LGASGVALGVCPSPSGPVEEKKSRDGEIQGDKCLKWYKKRTDEKEVESENMAKCKIGVEIQGSIIGEKIKTHKPKGALKRHRTKVANEGLK